MCEVITPDGPGKVWGIENGKVLVEIQWMELVAYDPEDVVAREDALC